MHVLSTIFFFFFCGNEVKKNSEKRSDKSRVKTKRKKKRKYKKWSYNKTEITRIIFNSFNFFARAYKTIASNTDILQLFNKRGFEN